MARKKISARSKDSRSIVSHPVVHKTDVADHTAKDATQLAVPKHNVSASNDESDDNEAEESEAESPHAEGDSTEDEDHEMDGTAPVPAETKPSKPKIHRRKTKRAPGAPTVPLSSYMFFCSEKRAEVKESLTDDSKGTEIMRTLGALWRALDEKGREHYNQLAAADKERYARELETYDGPMKVPVKRTKKEPGGPTQARSAFNFYQIKARSGLKEKFPLSTPTEISKMVSDSWGIMDENEKAPYKAFAEEDKLRFAKEDSENIKEIATMWQQTNPVPMNIANTVPMNIVNGSSLPKGNSKKKKEPGAPIKPRTAFNFYQSKARPTVKERNPDSTANEISSFVADCWNKMDPIDKKPFEAMATEDKQRYKTEMELYSVGK